MKQINKQVIVLLFLLVIPLVSADIIVKDQNGQQSAIINVQPYQIGPGNYADVFIQGINNYLGDEIFIKKLVYPVQLATGDIGLGRVSENLPEPFICVEGDLQCLQEKQNRGYVTVQSDADLFAFPSLQFDYATLKLKKYINNITSIVSCSNFSVNNFTCNSNFEEQNNNFLQDPLFIYLNLTHFSGWSGTSYFYADMEQPGVNLCTRNGDGYRGRCDTGTQAATDYTTNVFMDNEAMRISKASPSYYVYGYYILPSGNPETIRHYSRIYIYLPRNDTAGLSTMDAPIFSAVDGSGSTTSCGFVLDQESKEEISCMYDITSATYTPTEFGTMVNLTQWGLWDKWFTLEYFVTANSTGNCSCWINGTPIASAGNLNYDNNVRYLVVGYPLDNIDVGSFNLTFDEHRSSDKYIGGYPDIIATYVKYNPVNPSYTQTIYANITDNEGAGDVNKVLLTFNNTFNISMYRLGNSNTWEVNISSGNFTEGNNYTYTVYANDHNGQNAVPYTNNFLAGTCYYSVYLLQPTTTLNINITSNFTMRSCYNTTGTCLYPNWLYHQYYDGLWNLIPSTGNELTSLLNSFYINKCHKESNTNVTCTGTGEYQVRSNVNVNYSSPINVTCGTPEYRALQAIEIAINNTIPNSTRYVKQQIYTVTMNNQQSSGRFDTVAVLNNKTWGINYVNTTENFTNVNSLPYHVVNIFELNNVTYYEIISRVESFISSTFE